MQYRKYSFRYGEELFTFNPEFSALWGDIEEVLDSITDDDLITHFNNNPRQSKKSLSESINDLIDQRLVEIGWNRQSPIFNNSDYNKNEAWTLDFAKQDISIEVAFNHVSAISWNLLKPVLASELNHVEKAIQTKAGVLITATESLQKAGNFDIAIGTYQKYLKFLNPLSNILTVPMVIIGLEAPETFIINKKTKQIEMI